MQIWQCRRSTTSLQTFEMCKRGFFNVNCQLSFIKVLLKEPRYSHSYFWSGNLLTLFTSNSISILREYPEIFVYWNSWIFSNETFIRSPVHKILFVVGKTSLVYQNHFSADITHFLNNFPFIDFIDFIVDIIIVQQSQLNDVNSMIWISMTTKWNRLYSNKLKIDKYWSI